MKLLMIVLATAFALASTATFATTVRVVNHKVLEGRKIAFLPKLGREFVAGWARFREGSKPFSQSTFDPIVSGIDH